ncbi:unnamed protein product, partial [Rhizoctonia solani]
MEDGYNSEFVHCDTTASPTPQKIGKDRSQPIDLTAV